MLLAWFPRGCFCVCIARGSTSDWSEVVLNHRQPQSLPLCRQICVCVRSTSKSGSFQVCLDFTFYWALLDLPRVCMYAASTQPGGLIQALYCAFISRISLYVWLVFPLPVFPFVTMLRLQELLVLHLSPTNLVPFMDSATGQEWAALAGRLRFIPVSPALRGGATKMPELHGWWEQPQARMPQDSSVLTPSLSVFTSNCFSICCLCLVSKVLK